MRERRLIHLGLAVPVALLFVIFATVQLNDPDPWVWALAYLVVAGSWLWSGFKPLSHLPVRVLGVLYGLAAAWIWPGRIDGFTEQMMSSHPHIEQARESGGLVLGAIFLLVLARLLYRRETTQSNRTQASAAAS